MKCFLVASSNPELLNDIRRFCLVRGISLHKFREAFDVKDEDIEIHDFTNDIDSNSSTIPPHVLLRIKQCPSPGVTEMLKLKDQKISFVAKF